MEFEPSHAHHPHAVKREQIETPLNWSLGVSNMDQSNAFTMDVGAGIYAANCSRIANSNESYPNEGGSVEYGWTTRFELTESGGQGMNMPEQKGMGHAEANITTFSTISALGNENAILPYNSGGLKPMQDLTKGFATSASIDAASLEGPGFWAQQQPYSNAINNMIPFDHPTRATTGNNSLGLFAPRFEPMDSEVGYPFSTQELHAGPSLVDCPNLTAENTYPQELQDDEAPRMGYTSLTARPLTDDLFSIQAMPEFPNLGPISRDNTNISAPIGFQQTAMANIFDSIFDAGKLRLPGNAPSFTLSNAVDDYQRSLDSREASVAGNWESPRTPFSWENSISPSPNPQNFMFSGSQIEERILNGASSALVTAATMGPAPPTMDDLIGNFHISPLSGLNKRKRKAFSTEGKKKVNMVRESGACVSCHARKIPCSADDVCKSCIKTTGDPILAKEICLRRRLKDIYVSVKNLHGTLDDRKDRLRPLLASLTGDSKAVDLTVENTRLGYAFQLHLQVMKCTSSPSCRWKRLTKINGIYVTRDVIHAQRYVIVPSSLPSIDEFDSFGRKILSASNGSHSGELTRHLDDFLLAYCKGSQPSRLLRLANSTLRVASLNRLVAYGFLNLYDGSYDLLERTTGIPLMSGSRTRRYVSETVHDQLRLLAAEGLEPVEAFVFSEVDNLNKIIGTGRNGRTISGICVLRLMLLYRDRLIRDSIRLGLPRSGERHQIRLEKAAFMYKRLTIVYGTLCRESTPLNMNWVPENESLPTGEDLIMMELFSQLQPAFEEFCKEKLTSDHDEILKRLIVESPRIERRPSKKRKPAEEGLNSLNET